MAHPLEIILITNSSPLKHARHTHNTLKRSQNLLELCWLRKGMIRWFYQAESTLKYSRSTHYLTISVLDRLIVSNFNLEEQHHEVLGGAILLICSKFNESYPFSLKMLEFCPLMKYRHSRSDFIELQRKILQKLQYNIVQEQHFYENIAFLEQKLRLTCKDSVQKLIELSIKNPQLYRYGRNVLLKAIQHLASRTVAKAEHHCDSFFYEQVNQIITELLDLHLAWKRQSAKMRI